MDKSSKFEWVKIRAKAEGFAIFLVGFIDAWNKNNSRNGTWDRC